MTERARLTTAELAAQLLDSPASALHLAPADAAAMLATVEGVAAVLRIAAAPGPSRDGNRQLDEHTVAARNPASGCSTPAPVWLTPAEVAQQLRRTRAWVYRQAKAWPFVTRPSRKTLLISEQGLKRWLERQ